MCTGKPKNLIYFIAIFALLRWFKTEPTICPRCIEKLHLYMNLPIDSQINKLFCLFTYIWDTVLSTSYVLSHLIFTATLRDRYFYFLYLMGKELRNRKFRKFAKISPLEKKRCRFSTHVIFPQDLAGLSIQNKHMFLSDKSEFESWLYDSIRI